jgi:hypothetical protein
MVRCPTQGGTYCFSEGLFGGYESSEFPLALFGIQERGHEQHETNSVYKTLGEHEHDDWHCSWNGVLSTIMEQRLMNFSEKADVMEKLPLFASNAFSTMCIKTPAGFSQDMRATEIDCERMGTPYKRHASRHWCMQTPLSRPIYSLFHSEWRVYHSSRVKIEQTGIQLKDTDEEVDFSEISPWDRTKTYTPPYNLTMWDFVDALLQTKSSKIGNAHTDFFCGELEVKVQGEALHHMAIEITTVYCTDS